MLYKDKPYKLVQVVCEKDNCNKTFSVIISNIHTVVNRPVVKLKTNIRDELESLIDDYIVTKCDCGYSHRIYLKTRQCG